jgi:hypothetical protein
LVANKPHSGELPEDFQKYITQTCGYNQNLSFTNYKFDETFKYPAEDFASASSISSETLVDVPDDDDDYGSDNFYDSSPEPYR